ncbi:MAG TPA: DUF1501 domain-containing protein [Pirellulaceae bacterium]|jgi:uncharacterized protein (DUF1501 family)|nr:DUF1501 domain-containing protein [Pirellulaceae bacterium]
MPHRRGCCASIDSYYPGPEHAGVPLKLDPKNPLAFGTRQNTQTAQQQSNEFELIEELNRIAAEANPRDQQILARIKSSELAYRMQRAVPGAVSLADEPSEVNQLYGVDETATKVAGQRLLAARRLVERGVRFVQVFPSPYGSWDSHKQLKDNRGKMCKSVDKPIAGLLKDLKRRGLMDDVTVVFCTEFGRTPGLEERAGGTTGRDHHPNGFTVWLAGVRRGHVRGATDELGYHALGEGH